MTRNEHYQAVLAEVNRGRHNQWKQANWCSMPVVAGLAAAAAGFFLLVEAYMKGML